MKKYKFVFLILSSFILFICGCSKTNQVDSSLKISQEVRNIEILQYKNTFLTYTINEDNQKKFIDICNNQEEETNNLVLNTTIDKYISSNKKNLNEIRTSKEYITNIYIPYKLSLNTSYHSISYENIGSIDTFDIYLLALNYITEYTTTPYIIVIPFQIDNEWYCFETGTIFQWLKVTKKMEYWNDNLKTKEDILKMVETELFVE